MWMKEWGGHEPTVIYPLHDDKEHDKCSTECWCDPDVQWDPQTCETIIVHRAADGRRPHEGAPRKTEEVA